MKPCIKCKEPMPGYLTDRRMCANPKCELYDGLGKTLKAQKDALTDIAMNFAVWRALTIAAVSALAGGPGGDFTEKDIEDLDEATDWLQKIGERRGYYARKVSV